MVQNEVVITVEGLHRSYGKVKALDGISFQVKAGEIFGMLGPNGSGATTTTECTNDIKNLRYDTGHQMILTPYRGITVSPVKIGISSNWLWATSKRSKGSWWTSGKLNTCRAWLICTGKGRK
jgi:ABC-type molybdenum transport system ATPase subunit/photorepair protein PhrA